MIQFLQFTTFVVERVQETLSVNMTKNVGFIVYNSLVKVMT